MHFAKRHLDRVLILLVFASIAIFQSACSSSDPPPYYTAIVTSVYKEQTTVEHLSLLYWWEERGETPFLKPYTFTAKEFIVEVMTPAKNDSSRVMLTTERLSFETIKMIDMELTDTGKQISISTHDGRRILATTNFPNILKKDPAAGFADNKVFVQGKKNERNTMIDFKLELNYIKNITIINTTDR